MRRWQIPQTVIQAAKTAHTNDPVERARLKDLAHGLPVAMTTLTTLTASSEPAIAQWATTIRDKVTQAEQARIGDVLVSSGFDETGCTPDAYGVLDPEYDGQRIVAVVRGQDSAWERVTASGWESCNQPNGMPYMQLRGDTLADALEAMTAGASLLLYPSTPRGWLSTKVEQALVSAAQAIADPPPSPTEPGQVTSGVFAIVDPLNTSAILTLFHVSPGPAISVRKGGTWVPDDGTLHAQLQGFNPPPVVTVPPDQVADVLRQTDDFDAAHPGVASGPTGGATQSATVPDGSEPVDPGAIDDATPPDEPDATEDDPDAPDAITASSNWDKWNAEHPYIKKVVQVPIAELKPYRGHGLYKSTDKLEESIKKHGFNKKHPIRVNMSYNAKQQKVMPFFNDGHHRLAAAERAGLTHVPVALYAPTAEGNALAEKDALADTKASRDFHFPNWRADEAEEQAALKAWSEDAPRREKARLDKQTSWLRQRAKELRSEGNPELAARAEKEADDLEKGITASARPDGLKAAGLCVQASDTGRVFMLQRGLDEPGDPAKGRWEFPGGMLENGEHPLSGAIREWEEETGHTLPKGINDPQAQSWTSPNGIYQGYVHVIPAEADINLAERKIGTNPDDPDGDSFEAAAWWEPEHIAGSDNIRDELKHTMHQVHLALQSTDPALVAATMNHQRRVRQAKDLDVTFDAERAAGDQAEQEKRRQFETAVSSRFSILTAEGLDESEAASTIRREIEAETMRRDLWESHRADALLQEKERRLRVQPEIRMSKELHERQMALTADAVPHTRIPDALFKYWVHGKGAVKIRWGSSGDWSRCRDHLIKYVKSDYQAKALCAELHKFATGRWTGSKANKRIEGGK